MAGRRTCCHTNGRLKLLWTLGIAILLIVLISSSRLLQPLRQSYIGGNALGSNGSILGVSAGSAPPSAGKSGAQVRLPLCTKRLLKEHFVSSGHFPNNGTWTNAAKNNTIYNPEICRFKWGPEGPPANVIAKYLSGKSIALVGDSTGTRYFLGMLDILNAATGGCKVVKKERNSRAPDTKYFSRANPFFKDRMSVSNRYCSGCISATYRCDVTGGKPIQIESIAMTSLHDNTLTLHSTHTRGVFEWDAADSYQEFLFRYYFKETPPMLLFMFLPFNHAKFRSPFGLIRTEVAYISGLVDSFVPNNTEVYWMPTAAEFESRRKNTSAKFLNVKVDGLLATERIRRCNTLMHEVLRNKLNDLESNTYSFFDMVNMSLPMEQRSPDGVHLDAYWYRIVMSYLLQTVCS